MRFDGEPATRWEDARLFQDNLAELALRGRPTASTQPLRCSTPELTNTGSYEKCWKLENGRWVMHKRGTPEEIFSEAFAAELGKADLRQGTIPLYSNKTAQPYAGDAAALLSEQICSSVQWEKLIRSMAADGVDTFIEIGPGRTLTNMIQRIDPGVTAVTYTEYLKEAAC